MTPAALPRVPAADNRLCSFLFWPMSDWHFRRQRGQHLARALAGMGHRCYYFNPHLGRQFAAVYWFERGPLFSTVAPNILELHVRLPREPVYHHRLLHGRESARIAADLDAIAGCESAPVIQIVTLPTWMEAAELLRRRHGWPILYDCHDLIEGFSNMAPEIAAAERQSLERADRVLFSSQYLADLRLRDAPGVKKHSLLRNAVDSSWLEAGAISNARKPGDRPVIGYFGALDQWFDTEAVAYAARRRPEWTFRLIGAIASQDVANLGRLPNVQLPGEMPHSKLAAALSGFDVAIIPFRVLELTLATNPIKLYEYFSQGKPVVSSALPEVEAYGELVYIFDTAESFEQKLADAINENDPQRVQRRIDAASRETWDRRARELQSLANQYAGVPDASGDTARNQ